MKEVRLDAAFAIRQIKGNVSSDRLFDYLESETDGEVQAMLLQAFGFKGDAKVYEKIFSTSYNGNESAQELCAIYYLQQRDLFSDTRINKMLELLNSNDQSIREAASYFFFTMLQKNKDDEAIAGLLKKNRNIFL